MKPLTIATGLALSVASLAFSPVALAQGEPSQERIERRMDHLAEKLSLTEAQKLEVQTIFSEQATAQRELHERHKAEREALREQGDAKLSEVLSAEQKAQLDEMRAERRERWQERAEKRKRGHGWRRKD